jgi:hypothetical protein
MQFVRLIREANLPDRKVFVSEQEAARWLDQVLTPAEGSRVRSFLDRSLEARWL